MVGDVKNPDSPRPPDRRRRTIRIIVTLVIVAAVVSGCGIIVYDHYRTPGSAVPPQQIVNPCKVLNGTIGSTSLTLNQTRSASSCYQFSSVSDQVSLNWTAAPQPANFGIYSSPDNVQPQGYCSQDVQRLYFSQNASSGWWNSSSDNLTTSILNPNMTCARALLFEATSVRGGTLNPEEVGTVTIRWFPG
jgi:hypothetical protein